MTSDFRNDRSDFGTTQPAAYGWAAIAVIVAAVSRWLLNPLLGENVPYITFFLAVVVAAWFGGAKSAFLATIASALLAWFLFVPRYFSFDIADSSDLLGVILFVLMGLAITALGGALHNTVRRSTRAEREVREYAERLRTTLASIGDAVITTDVAARITNLNPVAESLTGWTNAQANGEPLDVVFRIVNESSREPVASPAERVLREGVVVGLANHTILVARDKTERPIDDSAAPIRGADGQIVGCVLVFRDVSERRRLEQEREERLLDARMLAAIVESSDDAIVSKSLDGIIRSWNAGAERLFGFRAEQAVGRHISLVIPPERAHEEDHIIAELRAGRRVDHFDTVRRRSDGRPVYVSLTISPIKDDAGRVIGASKIARDITARRSDEEERQRFVKVIENSTDFIGICDLQGVPLFVNSAGLKMVGLRDLEDARSQVVEDFFFPEDRTLIQEKFFPSVLKEGHGEVEIRFRHFQTGEPLWFVYKVLVLTDSDGKVIGYATVSQNVTQRRELEDHLRKLAADLSEASRRKDEFLATLAHELRNPLAPIRNGVQVLRLAADSATAEDARVMIERQVDQMVRLIDDLLDVSRITLGKFDLRRERANLSDVIESAVESSRPLIEHMGHTLTVSLPDTPVCVYADPTRLAQICSNLLNNSAKYTERGGQIWLTAEAAGSDVTVSVKDTGIGIAPDHLPHIFEMFSQVEGSLERSQGGLGIGLTLVKRLVEMHQGSVEARSQGPGTGAEFVVQMPIVVAEQGTDSTARNGQTDAFKSALRILIVDDNQDAANSLALLLRLMGNDTRTAYEGEEGVRLAKEIRPEIVLLDIGLPKLNGYEVCQRIREAPWGKDVVLIAVTGWGQEQDRRRSESVGFDGHLTKPIVPEQLMDLLADRHKSVEEH